MRLSRLLLLLTVGYMYVTMRGTQAFKDPELKEYVDVFVYKASIHNVIVDDTFLSIDFVPNFNTNPFGNKKSDIIGICYRSKAGSKLTRVLISREYFILATDLEKWMLVAHELGHCLLDLEHDDSHYNIMKSSMPPSYLYMDEWFLELLQTYKINQYIKEQFCK